MLASLLALSLFAPKAPATVEINGEVYEVRWSDGDSFRIKDGKYEGSGARLMGYNTLESYGPVHRFGTWTPEELYKIAKSAAQYARSQQWKCTAEDTRDHYGRLLVRCPDLINYMVGEGIAHLFEIDAVPTDEALAAQKKAREEKKGMWLKGQPKQLVTSVHSAAESEDGKTYDRVADLETGRTMRIEHSTVYETCQEICHGASCMTYVPFKNRYKDRAECLRGRRGEAVVTEAQLEKTPDELLQPKDPTANVKEGVPVEVKAAAPEGAKPAEGAEEKGGVLPEEDIIR